jgi:hypothetical protein
VVGVGVVVAEAGAPAAGLAAVRDMVARVLAAVLAVHSKQESAAARLPQAMQTARLHQGEEGAVDAAAAVVVLVGPAAEKGAAGEDHSIPSHPI